jgi:8-oxo-dGTP diphosphatase
MKCCDDLLRPPACPDVLSLVSSARVGSMRAAVRAVFRMVADIAAHDEREAADLRSTLAWLNRTDDVFRRAKPDTPDRHLVSYVAPVDPDRGCLLLGDHLNAGLWLPPGGHVEVDEHPADTARREAAEELGVDTSGRLSERPLFLSVTETVGIDSGHTDVSLWFIASLRRDEPVAFDRGEFRTMRWWSADELSSADSADFDPALDRFVRKLTMTEASSHA